jgi:hypothetical protein
LLFLLIPVMVAHLAQNTVPVTYAGVTKQPVVVPHSLTAGDAFVSVVDADSGSLHLLHMSATFSRNNQPVKGAAVTFTYDGYTVTCPNPKTTQGDGAAHCTGDITDANAAPFDIAALPDTYTATITGGPFDGTVAQGSMWKCTGDGSPLPNC